MKKIKTVKDLRDNLINELDLFYKSKKSESNLDRLNSISKCTSTIIRTAKTELEYAKYKGVDSNIDFLK